MPSDRSFLSLYQTAQELAAPLARLEADCPYRTSQRLHDYHRARSHLGKLLGVLGGLVGVAKPDEVPAETRRRHHKAKSSTFRRGETRIGQRFAADRRGQA
jgi:hypothetical protein